MENYYSQRLKMQILQENSYPAVTFDSDFDRKFDKLSKNYKIHDIASVKSFIEEHENILNFIHDLTQLINTYFPRYEKIIEFCKDSEFSDLDFIMIYIDGKSFDDDYETLTRFKNE